MQQFRQYKRVFKYSSYILLSGGVGWIYYQIRSAQHILDNLLDPTVLNIPENINLEKKPLAPPKEFLYMKYEYERNPFVRWWHALKFSYARRLLTLTCSDNSLIRMRALKSLAHVHDLDNWQCSLLASRIQAKTAVGLARTENCDKRLFMEPPLRYLTYNTSMLTNALKELLNSMFERSQHPCLGYFIEKMFVDDHVVGQSFEQEAIELNKYIQSGDSDIWTKCLESLVHHCSIEKYAKDLVELNGLPLLLEIHNRFKDNTEVSVVLCQILSFLSFDRNLLEPIFKSGWIGILAEWMQHTDVRISIPATRALINLDSDESEIYSSYLYLLYPGLRTHKEPKIDVIFVHGLLGGVFFTWRQRSKGPLSVSFIGKSAKRKRETILSEVKPTIIEESPSSNNDSRNTDFEYVWDDIPTKSNTVCDERFTCGTCDDLIQKPAEPYTFCWPRDWLSKDCSNVRLLGIHYRTSLSMWAPICTLEKVKFTLEETSNEILQQLITAGVGERPIVWVTHSMGGLIVKNILCKAFDSRTPNMKNICFNTKAIVFYSTPHQGSRFANLSQATALLLWPSVEVQELRENSPQLLKIHQKFLDIVKVLPIKIVTFLETKSTIVTALKFNFRFVEPDSGNPGVGEYFEIPQDHLGICKPQSRASFIYQKLLKVIQDVLSEN